MTMKQSTPISGNPVNLASFAQPSAWSDGQGSELQTTWLTADEKSITRMLPTSKANTWQYGVEWLENQEIASVDLQFDHPLPEGTRIQVQYWRKTFPTLAPERVEGARRGWIGCDDPFHGEWITVRGSGCFNGNSYTFQFDRLDLAEVQESQGHTIEEAEDYLPQFRRTLKVRALVESTEQPGIISFQAFSLRKWEQREIAILFGIQKKTTGDWSGQASVYFGYLIDIKPLSFEPDDNLLGDSAWNCAVTTQPKGLSLTVLCIAEPGVSRAQTMVTINSASHSFTFQVSDLEHGPIYIPDYDVLIHTEGENADVETILKKVDTGIISIYDRINTEPEASLEGNTSDVPPLDVCKQEPYGRYLPLSLEDGRQEIAVRYNGEVFIEKNCLKLSGRDAARLLYPGHLYRIRFGSGDPPDFRENRHATTQSVEEGWLPIIHSSWLDREVQYNETVLVAPISGKFPAPNNARGDEDIAAYIRFTIRNTTAIPKNCSLWVAISPQEQLKMAEDAIYGVGRVVPASPVQRQFKLDLYDAPRMRLKFNSSRSKGDFSLVSFCDSNPGSMSVQSTLLYQVALKGNETQEVYLTLPFNTPGSSEEIEPATEKTYQGILNKTTQYWKAIVNQGMDLDLPDAILEDLHKAFQVHVSISGDKDTTTGMTILPPGSWLYRACGNEACWQIVMLDQAGQHAKAEQLLKIFLETQGALGLDGNFTSKEGTLQGLDLDEGKPFHTHFSYNLDHGVIMECLADHYFYSGDRAWLEHYSANLVASCDFVIRERATTRTYDANGKVYAAWGLLPAGHLEDNVEWRHWFAVNAHACNGMRKIAVALAEIDSPDAARLQSEAEAYREDIRNATRRAMVEAPVVQLLDGTYCPYIPTRTHLRGRERGWFREAAYGAIHLLEGNIFAPNEPEMTWVIKDLEDNLYVSREWGRPVDLENHWFSHGGITIQPNLTDMAIDYIRRGQIKHGLRALWNNFAVSLYRDVRVFTEHPVVELGHGVGPFYKSSDEAKALVWLRAFLVAEQDDELWITYGAPKYWFSPGKRIALSRAATFFGPLSFKIESTEDEILVEIDPPTRKTPSILRLFLRCPDDKHLVKVFCNGKQLTCFNPQSGEISISQPSGKILIRALIE